MEQELLHAHQFYLCGSTRGLIGFFDGEGFTKGPASSGAILYGAGLVFIKSLKGKRF